MHRNWVFVENEGGEGLVQALLSEGLPPGVKYWVGQLEKAPDTGKLHFQSYVQLTRQQRMSWLKKNLSATAHLERARGTPQQNKDYCTKEDTRVDGPWEFGTMTTQGQRSDLWEVKEAIDAGATEKSLADDYFTTWCHNYKALREYKSLSVTPRNAPVETHVLYGGSGTGKSTYAKTNWPDAYYKSPQSEWWDGYAGQKVVIFDEHNSAWFKWDSFMTYLNPLGTPVKVEYKGGHHELQATVFVITTNKIPEEWYKTKDQACMSALYRRITYFYTFQQDHSFNKQIGYP